MTSRRRRGGSLALTLACALAATPAAGDGHGKELDCLIQPHLMVTLSTATEGVIERVAVDRGDLVKEGQVLATLESSVERASVAVNHARAEITNRRLAELELQRSAAELALRTIRSPITGVVVERLASAGEFAKQSPILKVAQIDPLRVEVFVPVSMIRLIKVGMRAQVSPEAPVNGSYPARVSVVDRVVDAASGTFGVRLEMANKGYLLPAGLKCKVRFDADASAPR